jgi:hypothetical protein
MLILFPNLAFYIFGNRSFKRVYHKLIQPVGVPVCLSEEPLPIWKEDTA